MLFIGDIHICKKQQEAILQQLRTFLAEHPHETQIIFLGDYVYHFTYERGALLALFGLFIELLHQGKEVWVLAGNHDRLQGHFVFDEARQLCALLGNDAQRLHIITQPQFATIEWQEILFLPSTPFADAVSAGKQYAFLEQEEHPNAKQSARLNQFLADTLIAWKTKENRQVLLVIHHRYIVNTIFPWQQARFSFTSPGLDASWLEEQDIRLLSGHLHSAFVHKNYLCTGSIWHTSPLETNEMKWLFTGSPTGKMHAHPCVINPYLVVEQQEEAVIDTTILDTLRQWYAQKSAQLLTGPLWDIAVPNDLPPLPLAQTTLTIRRPVVDYAALDTLVTEETQRLLADIKIKATTVLPSVLLEDMQDATLALTERISDWKILLRRYIDAKYADRAKAYWELLEEMKLV
jgi:predicted phosphodiesterase